jgi:branched-chain amino acid transport system permease protein
MPYMWKLVIGVTFVLVILAAPEGIGPLVMRLLRGGRREGQRAEAPELRAAADAAPAAGAKGAGAALEVSGVRKRFGSLLVLDGIDFTARRGELLSLVGPNGAGKTTLLRCIADGGERTAGDIVVNGRSIERKPPYECVGLGVGRKFQNANIFDALTVAETIRIAHARVDRPSLWSRSATLDLPQAGLRVMQATGLDQQLGVRVRHLSHGQKQALELAMVLSLEPSVLLLDEPTAGLTKPERTMIGEILVDLARNHDLCIVLVEHDLDFVREISSRVIVLHQGRIVLDGTVAEVVDSEIVRTIYSGARA